MLLLVVVLVTLVTSGEKSVYQVVRVTPPTLTKGEAIAFDKTNPWHIEAFVGSVRNNDKLVEKKDEEGVKRRVGFECTFEDGMCEEWQGVNNNIRWIYKQFDDSKMDHPMEVVRGPQHSVFTGPRVDHTRKSIYARYLYAAGLDAEEGDVYIIQTPSFDVTKNAACFSFWYHNLGGDFGTLELFLASKHSTARVDRLWSTRAEDKYKWETRRSHDVLGTRRLIILLYPTSLLFLE